MSADGNAKRSSCDCSRGEGKVVSSACAGGVDEGTDSERG